MYWAPTFEIEVASIRSETTKKTQKWMFPGYLYVGLEKELPQDMVYKIESLHGAIYFLKSGHNKGRPYLMREEELRKVFKKVREKRRTKKDKKKFSQGDKVEILSGQLNGIVGLVEQVTNNYITIEIEFFGRKTSVKVDKEDAYKI